MNTYRKTSLLLLGAIVVVGVAMATTLPIRKQNDPAQNQRQNQRPKFDREEFESQFPVVDYDAPEPADEKVRQKRRAKNRRFDKQGLVPSPHKAEKGQSTTRVDDWEVGLPPLPIAQSDVIVVGEVVSARAYLSDNKHGVYSEFSVRADELLKNSEQPEIAPNSILVAEREGGRVRFAPDVVELSSISGQGMPREGRRYVFFLKRVGEEESYHIVTGYELKENGVLPLDERSSSRSKFDLYKGADVNEFLKTLREAIAQPQPPKEGEKQP